MKYKRILSVLSIVVILALAFAAVPMMPALGAAGILTLSPIYGQVGTAVTVNGSGYTLGGTFTVTFDAIAVASGTVSAGNINAVFYIPAASRGVHYVNVATSGGDTTTTPASFTVTPEISLSTSSGYVGDQVTVSGTGFASSSTIYIYLDGTSVGSVNSGTNGSFVGFLLTVPQAARGNHTIQANDGSGASPSYTFSISPKMTISPASGAVGTQISLTGSGFSANSAMSFYMDDLLVTAPATTTAVNGSFTLSNLTIPATSYGIHTIKVQDASGASAVGTFTATQKMNIEPRSGTAGITVTISGSGFGGGKPISITFRGIAALTNPPSVVADASGNFSAVLTVPASAGGPQAITASDGNISSSDTFNVTSTAKIDVTKGDVGTSVNISGAGFSAQALVTTRWDSTQAAPPVNADANGVFSTTFKVPASRSGDHTITVSDGTNTKTFTFNVTPKIPNAQLSGYVGSDVTLKGEGFASGATVNITYDGTRITSAPVDANGNFTAIFKAPVSKGGNHLIAASDGTNSLTATFAMESTPPEAPLLLQPPDKTKADALTNFIWTGVNDPSGVVYTFQLATDITFNDIVLEKTDLANPGYKLSEKEKLPSRSAQQPYYWRVRAIDAASNVSAWSTTSNFFVGFVLPQWAFYAIAGAAVVIFFFLGFWLGRRTSGMSGDEGGGLEDNILRV